MSINEQVSFVFEDQIAKKVKRVPARATEFWAHFNRQSATVKTDIATHINETIVDTLLNESVRPHIDLLKKSALVLVLRGVNFNQGQNPEDMVSLRIYFDGQRLITVTNRHMESIRLVYHETANPEFEYHNTHDVFFEIINQVLTRIEKYIATLVSEIERIEDDFDDDGKITPHELNELRRKSSKLWRHLLPQQETLRKLSTATLAWLSDEEQHYLNHFFNTMSIQIEELNLIKERCELISNQVNTVVNQRINKNLYIISIISAVFIPLTFVAGLFGINVGGIPGSENPNAFLYFCLYMLGIGAVQAVILKWLKWY
jgi:zinc transporter